MIQTCNEIINNQERKNSHFKTLKLYTKTHKLFRKVRKQARWFNYKSKQTSVEKKKSKTSNYQTSK